MYTLSKHFQLLSYLWWMPKDWEPNHIKDSQIDNHVTYKTIYEIGFGFHTTHLTNQKIYKEQLHISNYQQCYQMGWSQSLKD